MHQLGQNDHLYICLIVIPAPCLMCTWHPECITTKEIFKIPTPTEEAGQYEISPQGSISTVSVSTNCFNLETTSTAKG